MAASLSSDVRLAAYGAAVTSTLMIGQQIASKSLRDALFLVHYPVSSLPVLTVVAAGLSLVMVLVMGRLMNRFSPARLVPAMFALSAALYAAEWMASGPFPKLVAVLVYVHTVTFGASVVSGFWSVINERFDPYVAKRVISTIGGGATLGGLLGGLAVWQLAPHIELESLILILALINLLCGVLLLRIGRPVGSAKTQRETTESTDPGSSTGTSAASVAKDAESEDGPASSGDSEAKATSAPESSSEPDEKEESGFGALRTMPYLRNIGLFVLLLALATALFDYVFKAEASARLADGEELVTFFALFYTVTGVTTFAVQNGVVRQMLVRLGLGPTISALPILIIVFGVGALVFPGFYSAVALRGVAVTAENSFHRSSYELLYTPLPPKKKRSVKLIIDVGADRLGTALGSGVTLVLLAITAQVEPFLVILCTILGGAILCVLVWLHRGYVAALADSMRRGMLPVASPGVDGGTARAALARTIADLGLGNLVRESRNATESEASMSAAGSERLREAIARHRQQRAGDKPPSRAPRRKPAPASDADPQIDVVTAIRSGKKEAIHAVLERPEAAEPMVLGFLFPHLSNAELAPLLVPHLRRFAPRMVGQLVDALLSPRHRPVVRGKIAHILASARTDRAAQGLLRALDSHSFEVAHQSAVALLWLSTAAPSLAPEDKLVFQHVLTELGKSSPNRRAYRPEPGFEASPFLEEGGGNVSMQLVHIFTLLALALDREPLMLAFRSLQESDATRGTGLEYLENVLPIDVRRALFRHIDTGEALRRPPDPDPELAAELGKALAQGELTLAEVREEYRRKRMG
ncbi:MAG: MFS transporter [Myxococcota bacterium]